MNLEGDLPKNLTNSPDGDDRRPKESPGGGSILFETNRDGNSEIHVMDSDGDADAVDSLSILQFVAALPVAPPPGCPDIGTPV